MNNFESIIVSDLHLGSNVCQSKRIIQFLTKIENEEIITKELILNGDVFDSWDIRRLCKQQWKILSKLRKLSKDISVIWIVGNHEESHSGLNPTEIISHLLGIEVLEEYIFESNDKKILVLHGHQFDDFICKYKTLTKLADFIYRRLQKIHIHWASWAKKRSKTFLRCSEKIEKESKEYAINKECNVVICGHTHLEISHPGDCSYYNAGCLTEIPCSYLTIKDGIIVLNQFT